MSRPVVQDQALGSRRARAASRRRSQLGDFRHRLGRTETVLDQPADINQASHRPPRADDVAVDFGTVTRDDVAKVLLVSDREGREVVERVPLARLGPVDDAGYLVSGDEDVVDLQVAVDEHRRPRPQVTLREPAVARDHLGGKDVVGDEPFALGVEL